MITTSRVSQITPAPLLEWVQHGAFQIARPRLKLLAKLDIYDADFREFARSKRATWSPEDKAWIFPAAKEIEILAGLDEMSLKMETRQIQNQAITEEVSEAMARDPFEFHSAHFNVQWDSALLCFRVMFPFDDNMGTRLREMGGRWNRELKCHLAPAGALPGILEITAPIARERALFAERNAPWVEREIADPLETVLAAQAPGLGKEGWALVDVSSDLLEQVYEVKFPFGLNSPLGREFIAPALQDSGCLDIVRIEHRERLYPKLRELSASFELSQRAKLQVGLIAVNALLGTLGPVQTLSFGAASPFTGRMQDRRAGPQPGEILISNTQAWLVSKIQRTKLRVVVKAHPLTAQQAKDRIANAAKHVQFRVASLAGFDITSLDAHVESLFLREVTQDKNPQTQSVKPRRL